MKPMSVQSRQVNGRWKLSALAALFAMPVILSTLLYTVGWRPTLAVNHGTLVRPPLHLGDLQLNDLAGQPIKIAHLKDWMLVVVGGRECDKTCRDSLHSIRQAHLAQGRERDRVLRLLIINEGKLPVWLPNVQKDYPDMKVVMGTKRSIDVLTRHGTRSGISPTQDQGRRIYVVDPAGNLMMTYPAEADPSHIRKDLKRLLRVSQIG